MGAFVGLLITSAANNSFFDKQFERYGVFGYNAPEVSVSYHEESIGYPAGTKISDFGGLRWSEDYELYRLKISNNGHKDIQHLDAYIPLPGCLIFVNDAGPSVGGDYDVSNVISARVTGLGYENINISKYSCSQKITVDTLPPDQGIVVEFVTKDSFDKCDLLLGVHPRPEVTLEYEWKKGGTEFREVVYSYHEDLESQYDEIYTKNDGEGAIIGEPIHNRKYAIFVIRNGSSFENAGSKCGMNFV